MTTEHPLPEGDAATTGLYTAAQCRALDACAIETHSIPGLTLMTRAGQAAFDALQARWPKARRIAVLCGPGNNGGDGFVLARVAHAAGLAPSVFLLGSSEAVGGDAALALSEMTAAGLSVEPLDAFRPDGFDVIVDGLFGTGLSRPLEGPLAALVRSVNAAAAPCLALDIPTGLCADTGQILGEAVRAALTVTFIGCKRGLVTGDGPDCCGDRVVETLGVPAAAYSTVPPGARRVDVGGLGHPLGRRPRRAHKNRFGHVLVVGGDHGYAGAARMCAEAAARSGAGLTSVATRAGHAAGIVAARPELMVRGVTGRSDLAPLLESASVVAAGPGLGREDWGVTLLGAVLDSSLPRVLDADALNLMADGAAPWTAAASAGCVVTPHPGEAARLLGVSSRAIEADRFAAAGALAEHTGAVVVLKGAGSVVQQPGGIPFVVDAGNPGMASGGMGDVLTGVVAAMLAQGLAPLQAALTAATVHATAGDDAARRDGERGLLASDLLPHLRARVAAL